MTEERNSSDGAERQRLARLHDYGPPTHGVADFSQ